MKEPKSTGPTNNQDYGIINWVYTKDNTKGSAFFDPLLPNQPIYSIAPRFSKSFAFSDIIKTYGEPPLISIRAEHSISLKMASYRIAIVYLSKGLYISNSGRDYDEKVKLLLTPELSLPYIWFFSSDLDKKTMKEIQGYSKWEGFKGFEYYCRDPYDATGKQDCSKTLKPNP